MQRHGNKIKNNIKTTQWGKTGPTITLTFSTRLGSRTWLQGSGNKECKAHSEVFCILQRVNL